MTKSLETSNMIRNFTAHEINFYHRDDVNYVSAIRKYVAKEGAEPYLTVPSEGMLSVAFENHLLEDVDALVPIYQKNVLRLDRLPKTQEGDMLVVSAAFASYRHLTDTAHVPLYTIHETVYGQSGKPIGCLGLVKNG
jgi:hypothetical protein